MVAEWLQKLLILQDRDSKCDGIQLQLARIPDQIAREEENIRKLEEVLKEKAEELKQLEVRRLDIEGEVEQTEANILKYKTQQMQVKKNEEYTALESEIRNLQEKVSELEDAELLLLEEIDSKSADYSTAKKVEVTERHTLEAHIELLKKNHAASQSELAESKAAVEDCGKQLDPSILQQYYYVKSQVSRPPVVVPLEDCRCKGCHLKVSGEVETEVRKGISLTRCDSCGRILYYDR